MEGEERGGGGEQGEELKEEESMGGEGVNKRACLHKC